MIIILIKNAALFTMAGKNYVSGSILTENKIIKKVAEQISEIENSDGIVIDASGLWVLPGLIDSHCHVGISEEKIGTVGMDDNEINKPITPWLRAMDAINPMDAAFHSAIKTGITSVMTGPGSSNVVGGQFAFIKTNGRNISDMIVSAPSAMKIALGENPKKNYGSNGIPSTRMSIAAMLREELFDAKTYFDKMQSGDDFKEDFKLECWVPVFKNKIPLKAHVHRADDILTAIRIAKEFNLKMTLDHCSEGHLIIDDIKASGYPAIIGPNLASRSKAELQYLDLKTAGELSKAGVKVAIMSDHPVTLIQYLPLYAGLAAKEGLGIEEGLKAITINAAEICGVSSRVGSIEAGKDADIAIYDGNPMETFTSCLYTIINGNIVYKA